MTSVQKKNKPAGGPDGLPAGLFSLSTTCCEQGQVFFCEILPLQLDYVSGSAILKTNV